MKKLILISILMTALIWANLAYASNVTVTNVELTNVNESAATVDVEFDLSQANTFSGTDANGASFCDRIWVFVKFWKDGWATDGSVAWGHATLTTGGTVSTYSSSTKTGVTSDGTGAFCQTGANQTVRFDVGNTTGVAINDTIKVRVMAIEMVYVPEGSFYLGDGSSSSRFRIAASDTPAEITTTGVVVKCTSSSYDDAYLEGDGILVDGDGGIDEDGTTEISNADFPTGYGAFFVMKYEISQGQYRDFLNTLTEAQASARFPNNFNNYRHCITRVDEDPYVYYCNLDGDSTYDEDVDGEWIACNYLSWEDGCAYTDWAGLRPMTELEFEKACRGGGSSAVAGECAWGSSSITAFTALYHSGQADEGPSTDSGSSVNKSCNLNYSDCDPDGPVRCGGFATGDTSRAQAGAAYYGVMEMSGNLYERTITLGNPEGRSFAGTHGNGNPSDANNSDWPGAAATGAGSRGGSWSSVASYSCVSNRGSAAYVNSGRNYNYGVRACRTSP